jgi:hypothetical protein
MSSLGIARCHLMDGVEVRWVWMMRNVLLWGIWDSINAGGVNRTPIKENGSGVGPTLLILRANSG